MATSNKDVVRGFYEHVINEKNLDAFSDYIHGDYIARGTPYVGMGCTMDTTSEENKVLILNVFDGSPASGKLMPGDEVVYAEDAQSKWKTYEELKMSLWGQGKPGTPVQIRVRRGGREIDLEIKRGMIEGFSLAAEESLRFMTDFLMTDCPDFQVEIVDIVEEGDIVVCFALNSGTDATYNQYAVWPSADFYRIKDGKIIEGWEVGDELSRMMQLGYKLEKPVAKAVS